MDNNLMQKIRSRSIKLAKKLPYICVKCGKTEELELHHIRYRLDIKEKDIVYLCKKCHRDEHSKQIPTKNFKKIKTTAYDVFMAKINNNLSKEEFLDSMTIKKRGSTIDKSIIWRPNNYRRQIEIKSLENSAKETTIKILEKLKYVYKVSKKKLINIYLSDNITIQIGKNKITSIWSQDKVGGYKLTYHIEANNINLLNKRLEEKKSKIREELDNAMELICNKLNLRKLKRPIWCRHEDWIKGDEYIDNIPRECIIHDTVFKKVYAEGIEFTGYKNDEPTVKIKNYIKNRAIEDIAPELADRIIMINPLTFIKDSILKGTGLLELEHYVKLLSRDDLMDLSDWTFRHGIGKI